MKIKQLNELGQKIFEHRYAYPGETKYSERCKAMAKHIASAEKDEEKESYERRFYEVLATGDFVPGGRIIFGSGRSRQNMLNCYVLEPEDNVDSIGKVIADMYKISCAGGGIGFNFSKIRPRGDDIQNIKNSAPGAVSVMRMINEIGNHVRAGKNRRTALMAELNVTHPDILEFLKVKLDLGELTNFNISVAITNRFIQACENDEEWYFTFNNRKYFMYEMTRVSPDGSTEQVQTVALDEKDAVERVKLHQLKNYNDTFTDVKQIPYKAIELWDKIWENSVKSGDPGIFNIDLANEYTNVSYFERMNATNPCVTEDTWVMTPSGAKKVKDLKTNSRMGQWTRAEYIVNGDIHGGTKFFNTGTKPVFRLNTKEGFTVDLTSNHKVLTPEGWVEAGDLTPGGKVLINNHTQSTRSWGVTGTKEIHAGYLIGHLIGDGTFGENRAILCSWGNPGDETSESYIESALMESFEWKKNSDSEREYRRAISCKKFTNLCLDYDVYQGNKKITDKIEEASSDFYRGFLGGLIDTDGSVQGTQEKGISVRITQADKDLLQRVQRMFLRLGIKSVIYKRKDSGNKPMPDGKGGLKDYFCQDLYELVISNDNLVKVRDLIVINNSDKLNKLNSAISNYKRSPNSTKFEVTFESLEPIGVREVFDVTVDEIHMFDGNGLVLHNCGEITLPPYGNCCLGNINLANMVDDNGEFDWKRLAQTVRMGVRFLDNVLTVNHYPIPECNEVGQRSRRIGLGVLGMHYMFIKLGIRYGSEKSLEFLDRLFSTIRDESYKTSVYLARDKSPFPAFNAKLYLQETFAKTLPARIRMMIKEHGIRNAVMLTVPPTGTISMVHGVSSGIEPIFAAMYMRRYRVANTWAEEVVLDPLFKEYLEQGKNLDLFVGAYDVTPEEHMKVQATIQKYIDNAISKTINLPGNAEWTEISKTALQYAPYLKGLTVYRAGSKGMEPLQAIPLTPENIERYAKPVVSTAAVEAASAEVCRIGDNSCGS